jgi:hypothetical protein
MPQITRAKLSSDSTVTCAQPVSLRHGRAGRRVVKHATCWKTSLILLFVGILLLFLNVIDLGHVGTSDTFPTAQKEERVSLDIPSVVEAQEEETGIISVYVPSLPQAARPISLGEPGVFKSIKERREIIQSLLDLYHESDDRRVSMRTSTIPLECYRLSNPLYQNKTKKPIKDVSKCRKFKEFEGIIRDSVPALWRALPNPNNKYVFTISLRCLDIEGEYHYGVDIETSAEMPKETYYSFKDGMMTLLLTSSVIEYEVRKD